MKFRIAVAAFALLSAASAPRADVIDDPSRPPPPTSYITRVVDVATGSGNVRYLLIVPADIAPTRGVMLFAGDKGALGITNTGGVGSALSGNFLVRTRMTFARNRVAVALVDTPGGRQIELSERMSTAYAQAMSTVITNFRRHANDTTANPAGSSLSKVWLVGTSTGTISAASVASLYPLVQSGGIPTKINLGRPDGIVLTSTISWMPTNNPGQCGGGTVFQTHLENVNVPAYVVAHNHDACACSPPGQTANIVSALQHAAPKASIAFEPYTPTSNGACSAYTPHGYYGVPEDNAVLAITNWVKQH